MTDFSLRTDKTVTQSALDNFINEVTCCLLLQESESPVIDRAQSAQSLKDLIWRRNFDARSYEAVISADIGKNCRLQNDFGWSVHAQLVKTADRPVVEINVNIVHNNATHLVTYIY